MNMFFFSLFLFLWAILNEVITGINFAEFLNRAYHLVIGSECYTTSLDSHNGRESFFFCLQSCFIVFKFADRISPEIWEVIN